MTVMKRLRRPAAWTLIFALLSVQAGCLGATAAKPPATMNAFKIDTDASELSSDWPFAENYRYVAANFLNDWGRRIDSPSIKPARFKITHSDETDIMYPWAFLPVIQMIFPMGKATTKVDVTLQVDDQLYTGSSSITYLVGLFYNRGSQMNVAFESATKEALAKASPQKVPFEW